MAQWFVDNLELGGFMADIFVSYASEDRERIKSLVALLENEGWSVWWDRELVAGPSFEEKIEMNRAGVPGDSSS